MGLILATQGRTFYICEFTLFLCTNKIKKKDNVCFFLFKLYNYSLVVVCLHEPGELLNYGTE